MSILVLALLSSVLLGTSSRLQRVLLLGRRVPNDDVRRRAPRPNDWRHRHAEA